MSGDFPYPGDDPLDLIRVSCAFDSEKSTVDTVLTTLTEASASMKANWVSDAATAAAGDLGKLHTVLTTVSTDFAAASTAVETYRSTLASIRLQVDALRASLSKANAVMTAEHNEMSRSGRFAEFNDMDAAQLTSYRKSITSDEGKAQRAINSLTEDYNALVRKANTATTTCSEALTATVTGHAYRGSTYTAVGLSQLLGLDGLSLLSAFDLKMATTKPNLTGKTPAQITAWWAGLPPQQRSDYIADWPAIIGNTNGIPLPDRATSNHARAESDLATAELSGDTAKVKLLKGLLRTGSSLVMYDPSKDHYGVLWGNIDASHIALFVPGVGDDGNVPGWVNSAKTIQTTAGPDSAVIMWKGYDDPGDHGTLDKATAGFTGRAETGATALTAFSTGGLQLGSNQSLTIVAHSYGSVVAGVALANDGLQPTNVVTAGSPGMTVDEVSELHLKPGQFFAEQAPGDFVANNLAGFGNDPTSPTFGGTRLATNAPGMPSVSGHSDYFDPGTKAVQDIAAVIDGKVTQSDIQHPGASDYAGAAARILVNPLGPVLDTAARDYHGPGSSVIGGVAHLDNVIANNVDTGVRNTTNAVESGAKKVWSWVS